MKTKIDHEFGYWTLRDEDGYLIDQQKTPAKIRHAKRRWFLYMTLPDSKLAWEILEGNHKIK